MTVNQALAQIKTKLTPKIDAALNEAVYPIVQLVEGEAIDDVVYSVQTSGYYERRGDMGGLGDYDNMVIEGGSASNGRLAVINITPANPYKNGRTASGGISGNYGYFDGTDLSYLVEYNTINKGLGRYDWWSGHPRQFTHEAIERLRSTGDHVSALKTGLKKQGIKVK